MGSSTATLTLPVEPVMPGAPGPNPPPPGAPQAASNTATTRLARTSFSAAKRRSMLIGSRMAPSLQGVPLYRRAPWSLAIVVMANPSLKS